MKNIIINLFQVTKSLKRRIKPSSIEGEERLSKFG